MREYSERLNELMGGWGMRLCDSVRMALDSCAMTRVEDNSSATGGDVNTWAASPTAPHNHLSLLQNLAVTLSSMTESGHRRKVYVRA